MGNQEQIAGASKAQEGSAPKEANSGIIARIKNQTAGYAAGLAITGAAFLSGCGNDQAAVQEPAKFSTIGNNAQIGLNDIEQAHTDRERLAGAVDGFYGAIKEVAADVKSGGDTTASFTAAKAQASALANTLESVKDSQSFSPGSSNVAALTSAIELFTSGSASALNKDNVAKAQETVHDWGRAVGRDVQMLERGVSAARIQKLEVLLRRGVSAIDSAMGSLSASGAAGSYDRGTEEHKAVISALENAKQGLEVASKTSQFRSISEDLRDAATLVGDTIMTLSTDENIKKYWERQVGETKSKGATTAQAAKDLMNAIAVDNQAELKNSLGAQAVAQGSGGTTNVYHHNSGIGFGDLLLYHMIFNSGPNYGYYPSAYTYSSPSRMYGSSSYGSYDRSYGNYRSSVGNNSAFRSSSRMSSAQSRGTTARSTNFGRSSGRNASGSSSRSGGGFGRSGGSRSGGS